MINSHLFKTAKTPTNKPPASVSLPHRFRLTATQKPCQSAFAGILWGAKHYRLKFLLRYAVTYNIVTPSTNNTDGNSDMAKSYSEMNKENTVTRAEAETALLNKIMGQLTPAMKRKIAKELERERKHFERSSSVGHEIWYDHKLAVCAEFERRIS